MIELETTINTILAICGAIGIIGGAGAMIHKFIRPAFKLSKRVTSLEVNSKKDYSQLEDLARHDRVICKSLLALLDHAITGNSIDKLRQCKEDMQQHLINK